MLLNLGFGKKLTLAALLLVIYTQQFGCQPAARQVGKELAKNPVTWNALIYAISTGAYLSQVRQSKPDEVLVTVSVPVQQSNNTTQNLKPSHAYYFYVNCRKINNDSAIIRRNNIAFDNLTLKDRKILVDVVRKTALPKCQKMLNKG